MNRGFLMALLALDLFVMGTSAYVLWDRIHRNFAPPVPKMLALQTPAAPAQPAPPVQAQAKPAATPQASKAPAERESAEATRPSETAREAIPFRRILFRYRDVVPRRVTIVGTFNRWKPQAMRKDRNHLWSIVLKLRPGTYAYNFVVDGKMIRDPANRRAKKAGQKIPSSVLVVQAR